MSIVNLVDYDKKIGGLMLAHTSNMVQNRFLGCQWSLWMLFVLLEFAWKREVSAIINPAKIGMILRLREFPESIQMVRG